MGKLLREGVEFFWGVILTIRIFLKLKATLRKYWTLIKIKIGMNCVYKEYKIKFKMLQIKFLLVLIWKFLFNGWGMNLWWGRRVGWCEKNLVLWASLLGGMSRFSAIEELCHPPNKEDFRGVQGSLGVRIQGSFRSVPKTNCFAKTHWKIFLQKMVAFCCH